VGVVGDGGWMMLVLREAGVGGWWLGWDGAMVPGEVCAGSGRQGSPVVSRSGAPSVVGALFCLRAQALAEEEE
jgi:hypothetical protein